MPDRVEEILKKIHILLAKGEAYHGSTDRVIISKREMFKILEELNEEVYHTLDQYEATSRSKERARLEFEREQAAIIDHTKRKTEEINAASLMYTDNMLDEVKEVIAETRATFEAEIKSVIERLDSACNDIEINKKDVMCKLREFEESERYERLLEEDRMKEGLGSDIDDETDDVEEDAPKRAEIVVKVHEPGDTGITMFGKRRGPKKTKEEKRQLLEEMKRPEELSDDDNLPEGHEGHYLASDFDLDREYFEFKEETEGAPAEPKENKKSVLDTFFNRNKIKSKVQ